MANSLGDHKTTLNKRSQQMFEENKEKIKEFLSNVKEEEFKDKPKMLASYKNIKSNYDYWATKRY